MALKYKTGDRVRIKSLDWYNENKDETDDIECSNNIWFYTEMSKFCGNIVTIAAVYKHAYNIKEDNGGSYWTDEMIEGLMEEETKVGTALNPIEPKSDANCITQSEVDVIKKAKTFWDSIKDAWICPEGYQFVDENGNVINAKKIVLEKKKKEYPKTYEECCKVLGVNSDNFLSIRNLYRDDGDEELTDYERDLLGKFNSLWELRICRDAYWKLYGEEMGLGKPWEPEYVNMGEKVYSIIRSCGVIKKNPICDFSKCYILEFPTKEMRDAFYENFKELIESCKELL